jgi:nucleotide-binding universal stress UspA family protein
VGATLVVANQTLPSAALADAIAKRIRSGVSAFHVVVPATPPASHGFTWDEEESRREAGERLEKFLAHLRSRGVEATGEVGDRDPVAAVRDAVRGREIDEILLSTLPPGVSRWLGQDVPSRLRGAVPLEVSVVYEQAKSATTG